MIGSVTPHEIAVWARLSGPFSFQLIYASNPDLKQAQKTEPVRAQKEQDYVVLARMTGLKPGSRIYYRVFVQGCPDKYLAALPPFSCRTAPGGPARFRIAYGSCPRFREDPVQPMWDAVALWNPDLFFWL
ncbi:MAG: PhoD-like phosphatase N-terminal domain-containing protein, partial [Acidobacteriota bacterium]